MDLNKAEIQLLYLINMVERSVRKVNKKTINTTGKKVYDENLLELSEAYKSLIKNEFVEEVNKEYSLTNKAKKYLKRIRANNFGELLVKIEKSEVYGKFCELVYGKNITQFNMMNMHQLNKLLELMKLNRHHRVLDLGCSSGTITEYISDLTNAHITGIDFAEKAIEWAEERTKSKKDRLKFITMDIDTIDFPEKSFDTIISIDTLYFMEDLKDTVLQMKGLLKQNGKMGIFYTQMIKPDDSQESLLPDKTKLAKILKEQNLKYQTWNFTEEEKRHWRKSKEVAETLKEEFEKEGNIQIYLSRIRESNKILEFVESDRLSRYLYFVEL